MPELPLSLQILSEACQKHGYDFTILDTYSQQMVEVSNGKSSFVTGAGSISLYPLNLNTSAQIARDKAHAYTLLQKKGIRIPRGDYFFLRPEYRELRGSGKELEDGIAFASRIGYPVFVKPNRASRGLFAEMIWTEEELRTHLALIAEMQIIALIQEAIQEDEYRIFVLDGEIEYAYRKSPPTIIGDGKNTISELLERHNERYQLENDRRIELTSPFLKEQIKAAGLKAAAILPLDFPLRIAAKGNIDAGGTVQDFREEFSEECRSWCRKVATVMNLRICGIDLFTTDKTLNNPESFTVIEVNRNPFLKGIYTAGHPEKALAIWEKILMKYFTAQSGKTTAA